MLAIVALSGSIAMAQQPGRADQEALKARYAQMLTHEWYAQGGWLTDLDVAKARSAQTGKPIFAYFTRTYAP